MANKNTKTNTNVVATVAVNTTADALFNKLLNKAELTKVKTADKSYVRVECDGKVGHMLNGIRNYFIDAFKKAEMLSTSADWTSRMIISATMNAPEYKDSFVSDTDFAEQIGQSKAFISKAKDVVEIREWLISNGYGKDWKPTTCEELIKTFKDFKKKKLDFNQFMKVTGIKSTATVKAVRDAKKAYADSLVTVKPKENPVTSTSVSNGNITPVTSTSVPNGNITPVTSTSVPNGNITPVTDMTANDVKTKLGFKEMSIAIDFSGTVININLTDKNDRKLANTILTVLTGKVKEEFKKLNN